MIPSPSRWSRPNTATKPRTTDESTLPAPTPAPTMTTTSSEHEQNGQMVNNCVLISTLVKVTEQFLSSVHQLETSNIQEQQFTSVMEHYDRLDMVIRVFKLAYPSPNSGNNNHMSIMGTTAHNASLAAMNIMNKLKDQLVAAAASSTTNKNTPVTVTTASASMPIVTSHQQQQQTVLLTQQQQQQQQSIKQEHVEEEEEPHFVNHQSGADNELLTISSNQFLCKFENTVNAFASQQRMDFKDVWESLLIHALPSDKLTWAQSTILYKGMDWYAAKNLYLTRYPDIKRPVIKRRSTFNNSSASSVADVKITEKATRITLPSKPPSTSDYIDQNEKKQIIERQSLYANYLLSLEMKEYEKIDAYNDKYSRCAKAACMNLNDPSLIKKYVCSLLQKYRDLVNALLSRGTFKPASLQEMMKLAETVVESEQKSRNLVYGKLCWKQCDMQQQQISTGNNGEDRKRPAPPPPNEIDNRPLKRFSSCA